MQQSNVPFTLISKYHILIGALNEEEWELKTETLTNINSLAHGRCGYDFES